LAPAVIYAAENGHYVGLHGYWLPPAGYGPLDRWHSLGRVVWNVEQWASMGVNLAKLRVLLNETGVDGLIEKRFPYKSWRSLVGLAQYASQVAQLEREMRTLPWLKAAMLFTAGYEGQWADYDHTEGDLRLILAELKALGVPAPQPVLPSADPLTLAAVASGKVGQMQDKIRWWTEEGVRRLERGEDALAIFRDLVDRDKGLLYHAERRAKELGL